MLQGVHLNFGGLQAVKNLDLIVNEGETLALVGPNGAGKTCILNLVTGFYRPSKGQILFYGKNLSSLKPDRIAKAGLARTFQKVELFYSLTCLQNVSLGACLMSENTSFSSILNLKSATKRSQKHITRSLEILDLLGLEPYAQRKPAELPFGLQRLLELGRCLATEPKVLLLDEPAAGLNTSEVEKLKDVLNALCKRQSITIVLVEHVLELVKGIADRVCVLHYGEKICEGNPVDVMRNKQVIEAYLGEGKVENV